VSIELHIPDHNAIDASSFRRNNKPCVENISADNHEMNNVPWANQALDGDHSSTLQLFQEGLTVNLIATARSEFVTCNSDEQVSSVIERNSAGAFDYLPVLASQSSGNNARTIIGLLEIAPFMDREAPSGFVHEKMQPLSEENLLGADASILTFVRDADYQPCRLIVSDIKISGIVSLSDLQRLPVRAALFAMVTYLEMIMAESIRSEFLGADGWIERLSVGRQRKVRDKVRSATSDDAFVDSLLFTEFCDKVTLIKQRPGLSWDPNLFEEELKAVQLLRDNIAHANDYASTRIDARRTCETVRLMDQWIGRIGETIPVGER
jgi:hypothetical protein